MTRATQTLETYTVTQDIKEQRNYEHKTTMTQTTQTLETYKVTQDIKEQHNYEHKTTMTQLRVKT